MLSGYKTYIVAGVGVITAVASYLTGDMTLAQAIPIVITSIMGATIRHGITTEASK